MNKDDVLTALYSMASKSLHREICGLVVADTLGAMEIIPIVNAAKNDQHFILQKSGFLRALNRIKQEGKTVLAVYHSHTNNDVTPSDTDIAACKRTGYNYLIVSPFGKYKWVEV